MLNKKLLNYIISGDTDKFYNSRTWRRKRLRIIDRDNKECQRCKANGGVTVATDDEPLQVHHKKHLKDYPLLALDDDNLITLCGTCHNELHPEKLKHKEKVLLNEEKW